MESPNPKFSLYGGTNECARSNTLLIPLSEVSTGVVSLKISLLSAKCPYWMHFLLSREDIHASPSLALSSPLSPATVIGSPSEVQCRAVWSTQWHCSAVRSMHIKHHITVLLSSTHDKF